VITEDKLVQRIARAIPSQIGRDKDGVRLGVGDDGAILRSGGGFEWVISCDSFVEGVHFFRDIHPPDSVGYKALVRATSDLVAMGAKPSIFLLALTLHRDYTGKWLDGFLAGMGRAARLLEMRLIGGDTTVGRIISASLSVFGQVREGQAVTRSCAHRGDRIYVSGRLGRAQLGLEMLRATVGSKIRASSTTPRIVSIGHNGATLGKLLRPHLYPRIRVALGMWLGRNRIASAMMDLSDGLSTDLGRLCEASGVGAKLWAEQIPRVRVPQAALGSAPRKKLDPLQMALHGGDDYELLFTVPRRNEPKVRRASARSRKAGLPELTCIGEIVRVTPQFRSDGGSRILLIAEDGQAKPLEPAGWDPFRK